MKIVFNDKDLTKALKKMKKGEEVLLYEKDINGYRELKEFQNYLSRLIVISRSEDLQIRGGLIFKKIKGRISKEESK